MNGVRYVEINARSFVFNFMQVLNDEKLVDEILNDEHYIFRIYPNAIEFGYPEDKPMLSTTTS